jgi:hypothetical protein
MRFVRVSGVTGAFLKVPPPIDVLLLVVVPSEVGLPVSVTELERRACIRRRSREPVNGQRCTLTFDTPSLYRQVCPYLREIAVREPPYCSDYRVPFERSLDCMKCSMRRFR